MNNTIQFVEFTDRHGRRILVNKHKVLSLYENDSPGATGKGKWTFIETAPDGQQDATGPIVAHTIDEVKARLEA